MMNKKIKCTFCKGSGNGCGGNGDCPYCKGIGITVIKSVLTLWKVTGYGGIKNKYGRYDQFKTVEVVANNKQEAIEFARQVLPPEKQVAFDVKEYSKVSSDQYQLGPVR